MSDSSESSSAGGRYAGRFLTAGLFLPAAVAEWEELPAGRFIAAEREELHAGRLMAAVSEAYFMLLAGISGQRQYCRAETKLTPDEYTK